MRLFGAIDDWRPGWTSFCDVLQDEQIGRTGSAYLTEIDRETQRRREWTRAEWVERVGSVAEGLAARGVRPGDAVAVLAGNHADALVIAFACWVSGFVYLPLNAHEPDERLEFILDDARAALLAYSPGETERARRLGRLLGVPTEIAGSLGERSCALPDVSGVDRPALQVYTSGTTGEPKGVRLTLRNLLTDCDALRRVTGWDARTRVLVVLPIHHVNGLVVSCLQAWTTGSSVVLCDRFRTEMFWKDVEGEGATTCSMVPTLLEFLLAHGGEPAPRGFREVLCGAGPLMTETVLGFEAAFRIPVRHLYGLSETTAVATMMPMLDDEPRHRLYRDYGFPSIGAAVPHVDVQVQTPQGDPCPAGQRGEIVIRGATVMEAYVGRPDATATAFRSGWFRSGDEGFWQSGPDGVPYYFVTGRLKELIIRGGVNISPFIVDEVLNAHPAVRFGLAISFDNRYYGEEIGAYVVRSAPLTEQDLLDFCGERLDFAYCPKVIIFGEDVPFTATGKARRLELKQQLAEQFAAYRSEQFRRNPGGRPTRVVASRVVRAEDSGGVPGTEV